MKRTPAQREQDTLANLDALAHRNNAWAKRLAQIKTAEALRGHPINADDTTPERKPQ